MTDLWGRVSGYRWCDECGTLNPANQPECSNADAHDPEDPQ